MKGQYFSFDVVIAISLFILTFIFVLSYWFNIHSVMETQYSSAQDVAQRIGNTLMTPGIPEDWDTGPVADIQTVGLAKNYNDPVLFKDKWTNLSSMDITDINEKLNTAGWDLCVNLTRVGSETANQVGSCDMPEDVYSATYTRFGAYDYGSGVDPVEIKIIVWRVAGSNFR